MQATAPARPATGITNTRIIVSNLHYEITPKDLTVRVIHVYYGLEHKGVLVVCFSWKKRAPEPPPLLSLHLNALFGSTVATVTGCRDCCNNYSQLDSFHVGLASLNSISVLNPSFRKVLRVRGSRRGCVETQRDIRHFIQIGLYPFLTPQTPN